MGPMPRKVRRWLARSLLGLFGVMVVASSLYNVLTRPEGRGPRDAGVPGEFVEIGGWLTHYERAGSGPLAVVLLHASGSWSFSWRPVLSALAADGRFTAYAPDMRGFGFTERPPDALYAPDGYAQHVIDFLDALDIDAAVLVGNSLGGDVALRVAMKRPDRVTGLVLADASTYESRSLLLTAARRLLFVPPFNRTMLRAVITRPSVIRAELGRVYHDPRSVDIEGIVTNRREPFRQRGAEDALIAMARTRWEPVPAEAVRRLALPALIVWGEEDRITPVDTGRRLNADLAGSRLVVYPAIGHAPHEEARERFSADLIRFCGPLAPPA